MTQRRHELGRSPCSSWPGWVNLWMSVPLESWYDPGASDTAPTLVGDRGRTGDGHAIRTKKRPRTSRELGEDLNRSFAPDYGSAVIPAGRVVLDPNWLLDELELRLTRCDWGLGQRRFRASSDALITIAQSYHGSADGEASSWWADHNLAGADERIQRAILCSMFERQPARLGWAAVTLLSGQGAHLLDPAMLRGVSGWVADASATTRFIRDAVALRLVGSWLEDQPDQVALAMLNELCFSENACKIRIGLMAAAGHLRRSNDLSKAFGQASLEICRHLAARTDAETAGAVGWLLRELLRKDDSRYFRELIDLCPILSRQAVRTAVERLAPDRRGSALSEWRRHHQSGGTVLRAARQPRHAR